VNRRVLAALSYAHFATDLPQGAVPALLPVFQAQYHLSYVQLGFIVLLSNISSSVIQPVFGVISDRVSIAWMMPVGTLVAGIGMLMTVLTHSYAVLIAMIFVAGVGVAAFHPEGYKFAGLASQQRRATGMSYFSVGGNVGIGLGPAAVSIAVATYGAYGFSYIIPISIAAAIVLWYMVLPWAAAQPRVQFRAPAPAEGRVAASASIATGAVAALVLLVGYVVLRSWVSTGTSNFIPLYFTGVRHLTPTYGGIVASVFLGAGAIGTLLGGIAADRWGHRAMLIASMAILPPFLWLIPHGTGVWPIVGSVFGGMAAVSSFAVAMVMAQSLIPHRIGLTSGLVIGFAVGTGGIGATALGAVADRWGVVSAMNVTALLPLAALAVALFLPKDSASLRNPDRGAARTSSSGGESQAGGDA